MKYSMKSYGRKFYYCKYKDSLDCSARASLNMKTGKIVRWDSNHNHDDLAQHMINKLVSDEISQESSIESSQCTS